MTDTTPLDLWAATTSETGRAIGRARALFALEWIYNWGWSTPSIIDASMAAKRRGLAAKLNRSGLLQATKTAAGAVLYDLPSKILTLTPLGLSEVERHKPESALLDYSLNPYRVNQLTLRHDVITQKTSLKNLLEKKITGYLTPRQMAAKSEAGIKQPDVCWIMPDGRKMAVEVELSAKFERKLDQFVLAIIQSLAGHRPRFDVCAVASDSPAILRRYKAAFAPGARVNKWAKNNQSKWSVEKTYTVPDWVESKMRWHLID